MPDATMERLARLRAEVEEARAVPMSASCMVNRADMLASIDEIVGGLPAELSAARKILDEQYEITHQAREQALEILEAARAEAKEIAGMSETVRLANEEADAIRAKARADAESITREADLFVDSRFAEFEASLQRTATQLQTMRTRLAERSHLDADVPGESDEPLGEV